jgi:glycine cleavage system transcriptional repressor
MVDGQMMVITVTAKDRPGIVAEVTEQVSRMGGNLADLSQTVLCGHFTMILVAAFPSAVTLEQVRHQLHTAAVASVSVMLHDGEEEVEALGDMAYVLTAMGKDRGGLVAQVSRFCLDRQINILDLASHAAGDLYTMILQIDLSKVPDVAQFQEELKLLSQRSGLRIALQHTDIFKATNEV